MTQHKLRITILGLNYAPEPTGNAPYTASLAEGLAAAGHKVRVITGYPHYPEWELRAGYQGWTRKEIINGVEIVRLRHYIPRNPGAVNRMCMELTFGLRLAFARWSKPDAVLVISPALFSSALAIFRTRLRPNRPAVGIWVQDIYSRGLVEMSGRPSRTARVLAAVESSILKSADGVVAIHERFRQYFVTSLGVSSNDVKVIRNWTHLPPSPPPGSVDTRSRFGWKPDDVVVLHAGNMGQKQGLENVLHAARLADESQSNVRFVLMGDGNQRRRLEEMASGIRSIEFTPPLSDGEFMDALAAADILLVNELPGVKDMAVPSKLTSYFNAGVPVIAATDPESVTAAEIAVSCGGVRVDPGDPQALLNAAENLGRDKPAAQAMGISGLKFRNETLSETAAIGHYDEFITSLALSRGR